MEGKEEKVGEERNWKRKKKEKKTAELEKEERRRGENFATEEKDLR